MIRAIFKLLFIRTGLIYIFMALPLMAQSEVNLTGKYEYLSGTESFEIRPNIIATVKYGLKRKIERIDIKVSSTIPSCDETNAAVLLNDGIIDEIISASVRGKFVYSFQIATSANNMNSIEVYSDLSISKKFIYCGNGFLGYRSVIIQFRPLTIKFLNTKS